MSNFQNLIKTLKINNISSEKIKLEVEKLKPGSTVADICLTLQDENTGLGLIETLVKEQIDLKQLEIILNLLDKKNVEIIAAIKKALIEAVKLSHFQSFDLMTRFLGQENLSENELKPFVLRHGNFRFIAQLFPNINFDSQEELLEISQNKHDLAHLFQQFSPELIRNVRDNAGNNVLHLCLQSKNRNCFLSTINNDEGMSLLYQNNNDGRSVVDVAYAAILESGKPDFSMLMLLDQAGADLETEREEYKPILAAYKNLPNYHHKFLLAKQAKIAREVHAISFNGGGAKGAAFMAAYREALNRKIISPELVNHYAGTSAGAITAAVFAMGFDIGRSSRELETFDFKQLMNKPTSSEIGQVKDSYIKKWVEYYQQGYYFYLISDLISALASESIFGGPVWKAVKQLTSTTTGIFKTDYLRDTLRRLISEKIAGTPLAHINPDHLTFQDFKENPAIFKQLTVYITNLTTSSTEKCSAETTPNMAVIDAVIHSASFPIFFEALPKHKITKDAQGNRIRELDLLDGKPVICCDGGVLKNDPVDAFDNGAFNENTLTFMLVSSDTKKQYEKQADQALAKVESSIQVLAQLYKLMRNVERKTLHDDIRNFARIVYIDTQNVGTLDFENAKENTPILAAAGQDGVIDYMNRRTTNNYVTLSNRIIFLLMSYDVAKYSASGNGQVVEVNPDKKLMPLQILRIYAAATDAEIKMLRSIINPNQRDENNVTALAIAVEKGFMTTAIRLRLAGSNIHLPHVVPQGLPSYLNRGEAFLQNALSDEELIQKDLLRTDNEAKLVAISRLETEKELLQQVLTEQQNQAEQKQAEISALQLQHLQLSVLRAEQEVVNEQHRLLNLELQAEKAQQAAEIRELKAALAAQKNELDSFQRYKEFKHPSYINQAVATLKIQKNKLISEFNAKLDEIKQQNGVVIPNNQESVVQTLSNEIACLQEIIADLENNYGQSARKIYFSANHKYPRFFGKPLNDTKKVLDQLIDAEEKEILLQGKRSSPQK